MAYPAAMAKPALSPCEKAILAMTSAQFLTAITQEEDTDADAEAHVSVDVDSSSHDTAPASPMTIASPTSTSFSSIWSSRRPSSSSYFSQLTTADDHDVNECDHSNQHGQQNNTSSLRFYDPWKDVPEALSVGACVVSIDPETMQPGVIMLQYSQDSHSTNSQWPTKGMHRLSRHNNHRNHHYHPKGHWSLPSGTVSEEDYSISAALARIVQQQASLSVTKIAGVLEETRHHLHRRGDMRARLDHNDHDHLSSGDDDDVSSSSGVSDKDSSSADADMIDIGSAGVAASFAAAYAARRARKVSISTITTDCSVCDSEMVAKTAAALREQEKQKRKMEKMEKKKQSPLWSSSRVRRARGLRELRNTMTTLTGEEALLSSFSDDDTEDEASELGCSDDADEAGYVSNSDESTCRLLRGGDDIDTDDSDNDDEDDAFHVAEASPGGLGPAPGWRSAFRNAFVRSTSHDSCHLADVADKYTDVNYKPLPQQAITTLVEDKDKIREGQDVHNDDKHAYGYTYSYAISSSSSGTDTSSDEDDDDDEIDKSEENENKTSHKDSKSRGYRECLQLNYIVLVANATMPWKTRTPASSPPSSGLLFPAPQTLPAPQSAQSCRQKCCQDPELPIIQGSSDNTTSSMNEMSIYRHHDGKKVVVASAAATVATIALVTEADIEACRMSPQTRNLVRQGIRWAKEYFAVGVDDMDNEHESLSPPHGQQEPQQQQEHEQQQQDEICPEMIPAKEEIDQRDGSSGDNSLADGGDDVQNDDDVVVPESAAETSSIASSSSSDLSFSDALWLRKLL